MKRTTWISTLILKTKRDSSHISKGVYMHMIACHILSHIFFLFTLFYSLLLVQFTNKWSGMPSFTKRFIKQVLGLDFHDRSPANPKPSASDTHPGIPRTDPGNAPSHLLINKTERRRPSRSYERSRHFFQSVSE
jgi:hypothetical protein